MGPWHFSAWGCGDFIKARMLATTRNEIGWWKFWLPWSSLIIQSNNTDSQTNILVGRTIAHPVRPPNYLIHTKIRHQFNYTIGYVVKMIRLEYGVISWMINENTIITRNMIKGSHGLTPRLVMYLMLFFMFVLVYWFIDVEWNGIMFRISYYLAHCIQYNPYKIHRIAASLRWLCLVCLWFSNRCLVERCFVDMYSQWTFYVLHLINRNIHMYSKCVSFLHTDMAQGVEILSHGRQGLIHLAQSESWVLLSWRPC